MNADALTVFERGWLSCNNVLIHGGPDGATLVDTSHCLHAEQTVALVQRALAGAPLARVLNTHLHSDHCGGNAALRRALGPQVPLAIPVGGWEAVQAWDDARLSFVPTGQRIERFAADEALHPGQVLTLGGRPWEVIAAPGHDPDAVMLFDCEHGVLIAGDALWENGFGVVFPELEGEQAFDDVAAVLERIASLPVRRVVPGHGAPFDDVAGALARAHSRLAGFRADPARHALHAAKVLVKYHLMEERRQALPELHAWAVRTPLLHTVRERVAAPQADLLRWVDHLLDELCRAGALRLDAGIVHDA
jgi:glyoxylase-like metal-dependent hydrolase (beta-lactamase superfamily II)